MKIIGKILLSFFIISFSFGAKLEVSNTQIAKGEKVVFSISAEGKDVEFPSIDEIDGNEVQSSTVSKSTSSQTSIINGKMTQKHTITQTKIYAFFPSKSLTIPIQTINVDGKEEYTKPVNIEVLSKDQMKNKIPYSLSMSVDKDDIYVGEILKLKVILKIHEQLKPQDLRMGLDELTNFWREKEANQNNYKSNGYNVYEAIYWLSPLKEGNISIKPAQVSIGFSSGYNDPFGSFFGNSLDYKTIASNPLKLKVKALPMGANAVGDFKISASVDKSQTKENEPINLNIKIDGLGNLASLKAFKPDISNVVAYDDKPSIKTDTSLGHFKSTFTQKIALVGQDSFTVPPFSFTYLDAKTKKLKTLHSKPININVKKQTKHEQSQIITPTKNNTQTKEVIKEVVTTNWAYVICAFFIGLILGYILNLLKPNFKTPKMNLFQNDKDILQDILPHKNKDKRLDEIIKNLEDNVYKNKTHKIDKKEIANILSKFT